MTVSAEGQVSGNSQGKQSATPENTVKSKAVGELPTALKEGLALFLYYNKDQSGRLRLRPPFTEDEKPICFKCKGMGHITKVESSLKVSQRILS